MKNTIKYSDALNHKGEVMICESGTNRENDNQQENQIIPQVIKTVGKLRLVKVKTMTGNTVEDVMLPDGTYVANYDFGAYYDCLDSEIKDVKGNLAIIQVLRGSYSFGYDFIDINTGKSIFDERKEHMEIKTNHNVVINRVYAQKYEFCYDDSYIIIHMSMYTSSDVYEHHKNIYSIKEKKYVMVDDIISGTLDKIYSFEIPDDYNLDNEPSLLRYLYYSTAEFKGKDYIDVNGMFVITKSFDNSGWFEMLIDSQGKSVFKKYNCYGDNGFDSIFVKSVNSIRACSNYHYTNGAGFNGNHNEDVHRFAICELSSYYGNDDPHQCVLMDDFTVPYICDNVTSEISIDMTTFDDVNNVMDSVGGYCFTVYTSKNDMLDVYGPYDDAHPINFENLKEHYLFSIDADYSWEARDEHAGHRLSTLGVIQTNRQTGPMRMVLIDGDFVYVNDDEFSIPLNDGSDQKILAYPDDDFIEIENNSESMSGSSGDYDYMFYNINDKECDNVTDMNIMIIDEKLADRELFPMNPIGRKYDTDGDVLVYRCKGLQKLDYYPTVLIKDMNDNIHLMHCRGSRESRYTDKFWDYASSDIEKLIISDDDNNILYCSYENDSDVFGMFAPYAGRFVKFVQQKPVEIGFVSSRYILKKPNNKYVIINIEADREELKEQYDNNEFDYIMNYRDYNAGSFDDRLDFEEGGTPIVDRDNKYTYFDCEHCRPFVFSDVDGGGEIWFDECHLPVYSEDDGCGIVKGIIGGKDRYFFIGYVEGLGTEDSFLETDVSIIRKSRRVKMWGLDEDEIQEYADKSKKLIDYYEDRLKEIE